MKSKLTIAAITSLLTLTIIFSSFNEPPKERYFFVGFACGEKVGGDWMSTTDGDFITINEAIDNIRGMEKVAGIVTVTSIFEFKNEKDFLKFAAQK